MEILPGLWMIEGLGQAYVYREADRFTLVDAGITGIAPKIFDALAAQGGRPEQLHTIILTHHHADHMGGCAELVARTDAQVMAHALEAPVIRGEQQPPEPQITEMERPFHEQAVKATPPAAPARVNRELDDGDEIDVGGGARVIHVPGHTPGSIALYLPAKRVLFTGDDVIVWVPSSGIAREEHSLGRQIEGDTARSVAWHMDDASAAAQIDLIPILQFSIHACRGGRRRRFDSPFMERALDL